ncbi:MAG: hypothetical protein MUF87_11585 [Anaerolineae bacterium]|nr:hypothetical protein [Anaerolineae bacterium]
MQKTVQHNNNSHNSGIQNIATGGSTITTGNISQIINGIPSNTKDQTLDTLLEQLKQALVEAPPGNEKKASKVADSIKEFLDESKKEEPDPDLLAAKGNALKKAAENIKESGRKHQRGDPRYPNDCDANRRACDPVGNGLKLTER